MIAYLLILFGMLMRLVPHVPNFTPVVAIALFAGVYLNKKMVPWIPLAIMVVSDLIIGFHDMVLFTWGAFLLIGFIGSWVKGRKSVSNIALGSIVSAVLFFVVSNLGVWLVWYPMTFEGLILCFVKAMPFFRNTLAATAVYSLVLFSLYELARKFVSQTKYKTVLLTN